MPKGVKIFCFFVVIPVLAVLGHDSYLAYLNFVEGKENWFYLSDVGWLWTTYHSESLEWARSIIGTEKWKTFIAPVLETTALYVALVPAFISYIILFLLWVMKLWPFTGAADKSAKIAKGKWQKKIKQKKGCGFAFDDPRQEKGAMKYKRK